MKPYKEPRGTYHLSLVSWLKLLQLWTLTHRSHSTRSNLFLSPLSYRNLFGEDLGPLNSKELESLERQLDMSLKQIRSTRVCHITSLWLSELILSSNHLMEDLRILIKYLFWPLRSHFILSWVDHCSWVPSKDCTRLTIRWVLQRGLLVTQK